MNAINVLVKTVIGLCDGQCGGEITLVTDASTEAYAMVEPARDTRFIEQDCTGIERRIADGAIVVHCSAVHLDGGSSCDGTATFTRRDLDDVTYTNDPSVNYMHPMDRS